MAWSAPLRGGRTPPFALNIKIINKIKPLTTKNDYRTS